MKLNCSQCQMLAINGIATHEIGCPKYAVCKCNGCKAELSNHEVYFANDWDGGIEYCKSCAEDVAYEQQFEMNDLEE